MLDTAENTDGLKLSMLNVEQQDIKATVVYVEDAVLR